MGNFITEEVPITVSASPILTKGVFALRLWHEAAGAWVSHTFAKFTTALVNVSVCATHVIA
jgi:hypothetical protein